MLPFSTVTWALSLAVSQAVLLGLVVSPATAHAEAPPPALTVAQKAKQHYLNGEAYFKAHDFSAAMGEYQSGYEEKPDPVFIFNVAQCQRLLGHPGPALQSYRRYLKEAPEGAGRSIAEKQIAELERIVGGDAAVAPAASASADAPAGRAGSPAATTPPPTSAVPPAGEARGAPASTAPSPPLVASTPPTASGSASQPASGAAARPVPALAMNDVPGSASTPSLVVARADEPPSRPIYKRWWFWIAAGAVTVGTLIAISAASSSDRPSCDVGRVCR